MVNDFTGTPSRREKKAPLRLKPLLKLTDDRSAKKRCATKVAMARKIAGRSHDYGTFACVGWSAPGLANFSSEQVSIEIEHRLNIAFIG